MAGLSWTAGLVSRRGTKAQGDAPVVAALRRAGGIPLAVTNVSELCMWMEANNKVESVPLGSAVVRAGVRADGEPVQGGEDGRRQQRRGGGGDSECRIALGDRQVSYHISLPCSMFCSDVGGSIRMPSFFNGIFGHKPSSGLVDNSGSLPVAHGKIDTFLGKLT